MGKQRFSVTKINNSKQGQLIEKHSIQCCKVTYKVVMILIAHYEASQPTCSTTHNIKRRQLLREKRGKLLYTFNIKQLVKQRF